MRSGTIWTGAFDTSSDPLSILHFWIEEVIWLVYNKKHCQRHNGPEDWVLLTKVTYFSHITRSNTKFDQISSSEYWPSTNFKISTSANISISTKLKILRYWPNLASESQPRFNFITFTKHQQQNTEQTPASNLAWTSTSKSWPNLVVKVWTKV